jgi:hypothetical protein
MLSSNSTRTVILAGIFIALVVVVIEGLWITDEERLEQHLDALKDSFASGEVDSVDALLADGFLFSGQRPVGEGDRGESLRRIEEFWKDTTEPSLNWRPTQLIVEGTVGRIEVSGTVRFRYADSLVIYRLDAVMVWSRSGEGWRLRKLDVPLMRPGIL